MSRNSLLGNLRDSETGRVSGEEEQGEEEQAAECGSKVCVGFSGCEILLLCSTKAKSCSW